MSLKRQIFVTNFKQDNWFTDTEFIQWYWEWILLEQIYLDLQKENNVKRILDWKSSMKGKEEKIVCLECWWLHWFSEECFNEWP